MEDLKEKNTLQNEYINSLSIAYLQAVAVNKINRVYNDSLFQDLNGVFKPLKIKNACLLACKLANKYDLLEYILYSSGFISDFIKLK